MKYSGLQRTEIIEAGAPGFSTPWFGDRRMARRRAGRLLLNLDFATESMVIATPPPLVETRIEGYTYDREYTTIPDHPEAGITSPHKICLDHRTSCAFMPLSHLPNRRNSKPPNEKPHERQKTNEGTQFRRNPKVDSLLEALYPQPRHAGEV